MEQLVKTLRRDEGCTLFPACLECPYPLCVTEEVPGGELALSNLLRAKTLALLSCVAGWSVEQIGTRFALSPRQVQRAIGFGGTRLSEVWLGGSPQRRLLQRGRPRKHNPVPNAPGESPLASRPLTPMKPSNETRPAPIFSPRTQLLPYDHHTRP